MAEKYIHQALFDYLVAEADVHAVVADRIFWGVYPNYNTDPPTMPYVIFNIVSDTQESLALGSADTGRPRISISIMGEQDDISVMRVIKNKLKNYAGTMQGVKIEWSDCSNSVSFLGDLTTNIWNHHFDWLPVYEEIQ